MLATADTLFVGAKNHVYAISLQTHVVVWQYDQHADNLALGDYKLFILHSIGDESNETMRKPILTAISLI